MTRRLGCFAKLCKINKDKDNLSYVFISVSKILQQHRYFMIDLLSIRMNFGYWHLLLVWIFNFRRISVVVAVSVVLAGYQ